MPTHAPVVNHANGRISSRQAQSFLLRPMSKRYFLVSSRIEQGLFLFYAPPEIGVSQVGRRHKIHRKAEQRLERRAQMRAISWVREATSAGRFAFIAFASSASRRKYSSDARACGTEMGMDILQGIQVADRLARALEPPADLHGTLRLAPSLDQSRCASRLRRALSSATSSCCRF